MSRPSYMALVALLAGALLWIAVHVAEAGTSRPKPRELVCPTRAALARLDADGCPPGRWGFSDRYLEGRRVAGRVQVCAEIVRLCAAR